jgi:fatty-acyl-CoA synthase
MDERGVIRIHGRVRDVIIRGGENIYPAEVEDVLLGHPAVAEVAVVGMPDDYWGEVPVGVVRIVPFASVTDAELEAHGRERLTSFKVPRRWERVDSFPLTASGKVKKYELQQRLSADVETEP